MPSLAATSLLTICFQGPTPEIPEPSPVPELVIAESALASAYLDDAARIVGRALISNRGFERLAHLCDEIGPRLSGSPQADQAVAWCLETMREDGFDHVFGQKVIVPVWTRGHCRVEITAPRPFELVACALGGSIGTPDGGVEAEIVEVESFEHLAQLGEAAIAGKIVFYDHQMRPSTPVFSDYGRKVGLRTQGAIEAAKYGAVATLVRSVGTNQARLAHTGAMRYDPRVPQIPAVAIAGEDAELLHRSLARGNRVRVRIDLGCQTHDDRESANVVADLRGREKPEEIVVIGGHLDSWDLGTGALDDGAGCIIAWEAARLLLELDLRPRRTLRVVLFMNEENGLAGGRTYAEENEERILQHVAAIESDSGAGRPLGFSCGGSPAAVEAVRQITLLLGGIGADSVRPGGHGGADIAPLGQRGVPCLGLRQDITRYFDFHHTPADTVDKVDPHDLARNIAAMAVMAYVLAEMPEALDSGTRGIANH